MNEDIQEVVVCISCYNGYQTKTVEDFKILYKDDGLPKIIFMIKDISHFVKTYNIKRMKLKNYEKNPMITLFDKFESQLEVISPKTGSFVTEFDIVSREDIRYSTKIRIIVSEK